MDKKEESELSSKTSNEILTELFGAFNAEPPTLNGKEKRRSSSEENDEKSTKKVKKMKSKKSKRKHKSKSKKHKKKSSDHEKSPDAEKSKKKKSKSKSKEKKHKKRSEPSGVVNYELPADKVPTALEIMLDGTVGIKRDDGVLTTISSVCDTEKNLSGSETVDEQKEVNDVSVEDVNKQQIESVTNEDSVEFRPYKVGKESESEPPRIFETEGLETGDLKQKRQIKIRDLKFSSVFQEAIRAVEEQKRKEEEKRASIEEGELVDSSNDEKHSEEGYNHEEYHEKTSKEYSKREYDRSKYRRLKKERSRRHSSRSLSRSRSRSYRHSSRERSSYKRYRTRSRSKSRSRDYYSRDDHRRYSPVYVRSNHSRTRNSHQSWSRSHRPRSRERRNSKEFKRFKRSSPDRSKSTEKIDKEKLLAIARKNALKLIDAGIVPGVEKVASIKAGGKTVNELTEYCKKLAEKDALGEDLSDIESDSSDEDEKLFHHPFQVRDRPNSIVMNIKNSVQIPVKSLQEKAAEQAKQLRLQFPVSSGSSHRRNESEWVPVSPKKIEAPAKQNVASLKPSLKPPEIPPSQIQQSAPQTPVPQYVSTVPPSESANEPTYPSVQPNHSMAKLDISVIVSKRLEAIRRLQENPHDTDAINLMLTAQQEMQYWAESRYESGAFTGSTGAKVLSASELSSGAQAWAKRDQLTNATPVSGGMGMALLQKMGWQPGQGLGKNKEGTLEPLRLEVKMDKKGLLASDETKRMRRSPSSNYLNNPNFNPNINSMGPPMPTPRPLDGKHPVSLLNELCSRRKFGVPQFELCFECGPDHKKNFLFKVKVNGVEYTPSIASPNKKQAKAEAAAICLQNLGIIP